MTAGAGDGMGLIVWREVDRSGFATLNASVREPPLSFTAPLAIASAPEYRRAPTRRRRSTHRVT